MRRWLVLGSFLSLLNACAEEERKPLTSARPGRGGSSSQGGSSTGGGGTGGGVTSGSGGSAGTSPLGALDPDEIYLAGTMFEGSTGSRALANVNDPDLAIIGFPGTYENTSAKMLDGRLVYSTIGDGRIWRFMPERQTTARYNVDTYPDTPEANDPELPTEPCSASDGNPVLQFLTSPDGRLVYECGDVWYEDGEELDTGGFQLFAMGYDELALIEGLGIIDLTDGSIIDSNLPAWFITARSFEDGFYVVDNDDGLWEVLATGEATLLGTYPIPPGSASPLRQTSELGPDNALYEVATYDLASEIIIRRTVDGESDVIYTEVDDPNVKAEPFASVLVTGP